MAKKAPAAEVPTLDERLRAAIAAFADGRSLNQLAQASGISPSQLSRFMNGERMLAFPAVVKVCKALGLDLLPVGSMPPANPSPAPADQIPQPKAGRPRKQKPTA